jgi:hypothetical protein
LTSAIEGTSSYAQEFQARGVRDSQGRSLRELDLETRMFRYPCSYMIYSAAFDGLPEEVRHTVLVKLRDILAGTDDSDSYHHLTSADRQHIIEILLDTKPEFAAIQRKGN